MQPQDLFTWLTTRKLSRVLVAIRLWVVAPAIFPAGAVYAEVPTVTNIFKPLSTPAESIYRSSILVLLVCAAIFLVVGGLLAYTVIRFRHRPEDQNREPPQIYA